LFCMSTVHTILYMKVKLNFNDFLRDSLAHKNDANKRPKKCRFYYKQHILCGTFLDDLKADIVLQMPSRIRIIIVFCRKLVISLCMYISVVFFFK
jgi:hypothetical protein